MAVAVIALNCEAQPLKPVAESGDKANVQSPVSFVPKLCLCPERDQAEGNEAEVFGAGGQFFILMVSQR